MIINGPVSCFHSARISHCSMATDNELEGKRQALDHFKLIQPKIAQSALKIAALLQHFELFEEAVNLNLFLRTNFSFNPLLQNIVERNLALMSHSSLKRAERQIRISYLEGRILLSEAIKQLVASIQDFTSKD